MPVMYLAAADVAERAGLSLETVRAYRSRGLLPEPDAIIGLDEARRPVPGWLPETIDHWTTHRLGRGYRSDLRGR